MSHGSRVNASVETLQTPCAVIDRVKLVSNADRILARARDLNVTLRPHVNSVKTVQAGEIATGGKRSHITVSTVKEAEAFFAAGYNDILFSSPITPTKFDRVASLWTEGCDIKVVLDDFQIACEIGSLAKTANVTVDVLIEIDADHLRSGRLVDDPALPIIARQLQDQDGTRFAGLLSHTSEAHDSPLTGSLSEMAEKERRAVNDVSDYLLASGYPTLIRSVGSTPSAVFVEHLEGITELRAGTYLLGDLCHVNQQCCSIDQIAVSVLCEVIGHKPERNWLITDAGWMALSNDASTGMQAAAGRGQNYLFGAACDAETCIPIADWRVFSMHQEEGYVTSLFGDPIDFSKYPIGSRLRILPSHSGMTGACHDKYYVVDGSTDVVDTWQRIDNW